MPKPLVQIVCKPFSGIRYLWVKIKNTILAVGSYNSQSDKGMSGYSLVSRKKTKNILFEFSLNTFVATLAK